MDQSFEILYRLEHRHKDGSWGEMVEDRAHHDSSQHDPERGWNLGRVFRCRNCPESVTLIPGEEASPPPRR